MATEVVPFAWLAHVSVIMIVLECAATCATQNQKLCFNARGKVAQAMHEMQVL
jgi:hypothetical protein